MRTHAQIIADAGGYQKLAERLGESSERVRFWQRRQSIPAEFWSLIARHKIAGLAELSKATAARKHKARAA